METPYDWVTVAIFAGLIVLFLHRSVGPQRDNDSIWQYLGASVGCAVANWLGNKGWDEGNAMLHVLAVVVILATLGYTWVFLRPFSPPR
ncbi:XrtV sorting system accessory protein [Sphingomonas sp. ID0503]|uniref:XrtV sorting system accessory protein n=1 Tax=Sphingomonas sp. ID0503 TaxID=3399691 RepID=UPI003AFB7C3E